MKTSYLPPKYETIFHIRPDLALIKLDDCTRSRDLTVVVQGTDGFAASLAMDGMYEFHMKSRMILSPNSH